MYMEKQIKSNGTYKIYLRTIFYFTKHNDQIIKSITLYLRSSYYRALHEF